MPSLEEMYTKKYTNIGENHNIDPSCETTETNEEEVQEDLKDEDDVKARPLYLLEDFLKWKYVNGVKNSSSYIP